MSIPVLTAICISVTLLLAFFGLFSVLSSRKTRQDWRKRAEGTARQTPATAAQGRSAPRDRPVAKFLGAVGEAASPQDEAQRSHVRRTLVQAGYRGAEAPLVFFGAKLCCAVLLPLGFAMLRVSALTTLPHTHTVGLFVLAGVLGFYLPHLWIQRQISSRKQKITEGFPDALDLMVVCVEAGLGLDAAIQRVGDDLKLSNKVLSEEFQLLNLGLRAGQSRETTLRNLSQRTDLEDINNWVTMLIQTDRFGTSMAQTLRVHSDSMRTKRHQRAEELAAKLPVKLLIPLIFFIFPSLFVVILGPAVIQMVRVLLPTLAGG